MTVVDLTTEDRAAVMRALSDLHAAIGRLAIVAGALDLGDAVDAEFIRMKSAREALYKAIRRSGVDSGINFDDPAIVVRFDIGRLRFDVDSVS